MTRRSGGEPVLSTQRVILLNPKGGSGKTTIATSLASYFAANEGPTMLVDYDAQGSSTRWLRVRPALLPEIHGVAAFRSPAGITRSFHMRAPSGTRRIVIDTPAGVRADEFRQLIRPTDTVVIPVLASHIDIDAAAHFIDKLRTHPSIREGRTRVAVVANRVRARTLILEELESFLRRVSFPFVARFRESRYYLQASERGLGIHELPVNESAMDCAHWAPLVDWLSGHNVDEPCSGADRSSRRRVAAHA